MIKMYNNSNSNKLNNKLINNNHNKYRFNNIMLKNYN